MFPEEVAYYHPEGVIGRTVLTQRVFVTLYCEQDGAAYTLTDVAMADDKLEHFAFEAPLPSRWIDHVPVKVTLQREVPRRPNRREIDVFPHAQVQRLKSKSLIDHVYHVNRKPTQP